MSSLDEAGLGERLDRFRETAHEIEHNLTKARNCLVEPVADAFMFLVEVEGSLANVESDPDYSEALVRSGARAILDRLEDLRAILSAR